MNITKSVSWTLGVTILLLLVFGFMVPEVYVVGDVGRRHRSEADLKVLAAALQARGRSAAPHPMTADGLSTTAVLSDPLTPKYLRLLPAKDGWGQEYYY